MPSLVDRLSPTATRTPPHRLPERMDAPGCDPERLSEALDTLERVNRWLGGARLAVSETLRAAPPGHVRILDVGSGAGDIAVRLARRLERERRRGSFVLADLHAETLRLSRRRLARGDRGSDRFRFVRLDGVRLPFRTDAFDVALCSATLHHLETEEAVALLGELDRVSRVGWVVTDLLRTPLAYLGVRLLSATVWRRRPFPRQDGPASVLRAFTVPEARELLRAAGLGHRARVVSRAFRLAIRGGGSRA